MSIFKTWTDYHHRLNLIFHAIVAITMLPFVWLFLEVDANDKQGILQDNFVLVFFAIICLSLTATSHLFKKKQLMEASAKEDLRSKLKAYMPVQITTFALLEGAAVFATLAFYLTASYVFAVIYIFILFVFSLSRPNIDRTVRELKLSKEDREVLINREEIANNE